MNIETELDAHKRLRWIYIAVILALVALLIWKCRDPEPVLAKDREIYNKTIETVDAHDKQSEGVLKFKDSTDKVISKSKDSIERLHEDFNTLAADYRKLKESKTDPVYKSYNASKWAGYFKGQYPKFAGQVSEINGSVSIGDSISRAVAVDVSNGEIAVKKVGNLENQVSDLVRETVQYKNSLELSQKTADTVANSLYTARRDIHELKLQYTDQLRKKEKQFKSIKRTRTMFEVATGAALIGGFFLGRQ